MLNSIFKKTVISLPINWDKFVFVRLSNINLMEAGGAEENEQMYQKGLPCKANRNTKVILWNLFGDVNLS